MASPRELEKMNFKNMFSFTPPNWDVVVRIVIRTSTWPTTNTLKANMSCLYVERTFQNINFDVELLVSVSSIHLVYPGLCFKFGLSWESITPYFTAAFQHWDPWIILAHILKCTVLNLMKSLFDIFVGPKSDRKVNCHFLKIYLIF